MISAMVERSIRATEAELGESADYLRDIYRASPAALFKFGLFLPFAAHRKSVPKPVLHVARLVASLAQDCGPCVQIVLNQARKDDVPADVLRAVIDERPECLPDDLTEAYLFARAVVDKDPRADELRAALSARYGDAAIVDLAFGIAGAQVFPIVKRVMGHGQSCQRYAFEV